jgi:hypothetical protein
VSCPIGESRTKQPKSGKPEKIKKNKNTKLCSPDPETKYPVLSENPGLNNQSLGSRKKKKKENKKTNQEDSRILRPSWMLEQCLGH